MKASVYRFKAYWRRSLRESTVPWEDCRVSEGKLRFRQLCYNDVTKFCMIVIPFSVIMLSGWNCTPCTHGTSISQIGCSQHCVRAGVVPLITRDKLHITAYSSEGHLDVRELFVANGHDGTVFGPSRHIQRLRAALPLDDQAVVPRGLERVAQRLQGTREAQEFPQTAQVEFHTATFLGI